MNSSLILRLVLLASLFLGLGCGCDFQRRQPVPVASPRAKVDITVCGLRLGDPVSKAWKVKKEHEDELISYDDFEDDGLVQIYGTTATINGVRFQDGDSVAEVLEVLGPPKEKYPSDYPPPDKTVRYDYPDLGFGFHADENEEYVAAGFGLFRTSPMRHRQKTQKTHKPKTPSPRI